MKISFVGPEELFTSFPLSEDERAEAAEYVSSDPDYDAELSYSFVHGCLLFRLYSEQTGYYFWPAVPISECFNKEAAYREIAEYCRLEAIPELYFDIPAEDKNYITANAPHAVLHDMDDGQTYAIEIFTECMLAEALPEHMCGELYFGEFAPSYDEDYARLVLDPEVNKYFGYSACDDIPNGGGAEFREAATAQFASGESMTFALTVYREGRNVFVGEAALYGFDGRGGAEIAFRLLPEWQGVGLGKTALLGCLEIAGKLGLKSVKARVMEQNVRSVGLLSSFAPSSCSERGVRVFEFLSDADGNFL